MIKRAQSGFRVWILVAVIVCVLPQMIQAEEILVSDFYYDTFIVDALSDLALQAGVPIVADSSVSGFVTMEFEQVPFEEALQRLCVPLGLTYRLMPEGYYLVGAAEANNPTFGLLSETQTFKTNYIKAETLYRLLSDFYRPFIKVDETLNTIVATASPEMLSRLEADIARIDTPVRQVLLEVLVMELTEDARRALGTEWHWDATRQDGETSGGLELLVGALRSTSSVSYRHPAGITSFLLSLKPMVESGQARVHANPRIAALDGHPADIFLGQEQSYIVETETATGTITRQRVAIKSGVTLHFLAQIAPNGEVTVQVEPEVSQSTGFNQDGFPIISSRRASTTVRVADGETFVIGGLLHEFETETTGKVPLLGDIPLLGRLFRNERIEQSETEVMIMITPHILDEEVASQ